MTDAEFDKRASSTPDPYTLAWFKKQLAEITTGYRGATHGINRAMALYDDFVSENAALRKQVAALEQERDKDRAKIGELQARVERIAAWVSSQANSKAKGGG